MKYFLKFSPEQMRQQYARNAESLRFMLIKAKINGMYNGYTAEQLAEKVKQFEELAKNYGNSNDSGVVRP